MATFNTLSKVVYKPPSSTRGAAAANPLLQPETPAESSWWSRGLDWLQTEQDVAGMIPVAGIVADIANAGISLTRGDYAGAAQSIN